MPTFMAVCLALIVLELGVMIIVFTVAMLKVRDAAQAVQTAASRLDKEVEQIGVSLRSSWSHSLKTLLSAGWQVFKSGL